MNILVVEDDADISAFVSRGLRGAGYNVDSASDGLSGEKMARAAIYDAAIIDLMLPGLDGLTLIQHLRQTKLTTPIIVLSAKRSSSDKVACLCRGADDYLLERLWDFNIEPQTNVVDVLVCRLRERLDRNFSVKLIHTVRAIGYVFRPS